MEAHAQSCIHDGTNKNIYVKIFLFGRIVCFCQRVSKSDDKVRVFYAIKNLSSFTRMVLTKVVTVGRRCYFKPKLDLAHRRTDANCIHRKDNAPKPLGPIISEL